MTKTHHDIVVAYGAPDRVESDGNGGKILVYETVSTNTKTDVDSSLVFKSVEYKTTTSTSKSYAHFFLDEDGVCYLVKSNRNMPGGEHERQSTSFVIKFTAIAFSCISLLGLLMSIG